MRDVHYYVHTHNTLSLHSTYYEHGFMSPFFDACRLLLVEFLVSLSVL